MSTLLLGSLISGSRSEGQGGWSREGRGEPNKDVKWSLCSGRLLRHVGQKSGKLIPPRKALSTIFSFLLVKFYVMCYSIPPFQVAHMQWPGELQGTAGKLLYESWETVWGRDCMKLVRACQELATWASTGTRSGWSWEHLTLYGRGSDTLDDLCFSHRHQLTGQFLREALPDPKPNVDPFSNIRRVSHT